MPPTGRQIVIIQKELRAMTVTVPPQASRNAEQPPVTVNRNPDDRRYVELPDKSSR
jgi:hypothetical protein